MHVHVHIDIGRWIVTYFQEVHNHEMLADELTFMLPGHRKMDAGAINQMNMMLKVGIKTPQIYASFVNTVGGFHNVPFLKRDMYNQIDKQQRLLGRDAMACLKVSRPVGDDGFKTWPRRWFQNLASRIINGRKMWATAHIRGHFFGGFRMTSRCEGLHSMLGKFVHSWHTLRDFVEQFFRCISQMRSRECQTDMEFVVGNLVLQSPLHALERSVANILTREIFLLFRPMLTKACSLKVRSCTLTPTCEIYTFHGRAIHGRSGRYLTTLVLLCLSALA
ncbi:hypothetical protein Ahy_B10g101821 [Arachis hypogaea]|uniref:Uncharacterized protein n=1 Tax=Arachis hypogaea TaxID=3818 RepID=A0A444X0J9_ARAHY|nr:hypothetical protein Ahy_B10g101821 [Arachis hypogaea]